MKTKRRAIKIYKDLAKSIDAISLREQLKKTLVEGRILTNQQLAEVTGIKPQYWHNWTPVNKKRPSLMPSTVIISLCITYGLDLEAMVNESKIKKIQKEACYE